MSPLIQITDGAIYYYQAATDPMPDGFHKVEAEKKPAKKQEKVEKEEKKEVTKKTKKK